MLVVHAPYSSTEIALFFLFCVPETFSRWNEPELQPEIKNSLRNKSLHITSAPSYKRRTGDLQDIYECLRFCVCSRELQSSSRPSNVLHFLTESVNNLNFERTDFSKKQKKPQNKPVMNILVTQLHFLTTHSYRFEMFVFTLCGVPRMRMGSSFLLMFLPNVGHLREFISATLATGFLVRDTFIHSFILLYC